MPIVRHLLQLFDQIIHVSLLSRKRSPPISIVIFLWLYETTLPPEERGGETKHSFGGVG
ncbi:hypothetical protein [Nostoc sp.]|uniref:hypothetical protein n=1 Tax=Nostoc sp. TaxID=1180 RepID=UPI002FFA7FB3